MKDIIWDKIKQGNYAITQDGKVFSYYKHDFMKTKIDKDGLNNTVGENHERAIISEEEAKQIIQLLNQGKSSTQIMKKIPNATKKIIFHIKYGETWKHLPR